MRNKIQTSLATLALLLGMLALALNVRLEAQLRNTIPTPAEFVDYTGTNRIVIGSSLQTPIQIWYGTNVNTGITSTNRQFLGGTGVTNTFLIRDGIITGIQ